MGKYELDLHDIHLSTNFLFQIFGETEDLIQLKVLLFAIGLAQQSGDEANPLTLQDFYSYPEFMNTIGSSEEEMREKLLSALRANLKTGYLLCSSFEEMKQGKSFYLNTPRGKQAAQIQGTPAKSPVYDLSWSELFKLYEENIGPLTPLIADALKDAEKEYSKEWLEEAIRIAVVNNVRKWRYIQAILNSWKEEGRNGRNQRHTEEDYEQYTKGKYGKFIKH